MKLLQKFDTTFFETQCIIVLVSSNTSTNEGSIRNYLTGWCKTGVTNQHLSADNHVSGN